MDENRNLRRTPVSTVNGLQRRRQRDTKFRDSTDGDKQMELKETVRLRDREQLEKGRDLNFPKRRRVDNRYAVQQKSGGGSYRDESTDSDEEYFEEEENTRTHQQNRTNQLSTASSSPSNNRRGLRTLRSSPLHRAAADEVLGVPIPRRARTASAKKFHEYRNSACGGYEEDLSHRKFPPPPAAMSPIGFGSASPSSSGASMKKKMKYVEPRTRGLSSASNSKPSSVIQDDIEIEVAEALFDLMKQSHSQSQSQSSEREEVDRDGTDNDDDDDFKKLKAERGEDEKDAFKIQNEQSIEVNSETILADSMKELNKGGRIEKEKFPDDPAQELVSGDGFVDNGKVGSPKESESPSCVKVQDPTVTKAGYAACVVVEAKEPRMEIDLMALPSLPSSPERDDAVLDIDPKVRTQDVQKKSKTTTKDGTQMPEEKIGVISDNQLLNLNLEKHRHDISSVRESITQQPLGWKEPKNQSPTSLLSFPIGTGSWPGVLPHPGYIPSHRAVLPKDGSARSSMTMQPPPFKFSQHRRKRCATHQYIAHNIHKHQQLTEKSLSSGPNGAATLYGNKQLNFKSMLPTQRFIPVGNPLLGGFEGGQNLATILGGSGIDKTSDFNVTISGNSVLQQTSNQAPSHNFLHNPTFALGRHQTTTTAPPNSSGPPQSASAVSNLSMPSNSSSRKLPVKNASLPEASNAVSFNHPIFPSNESAASYMAIVQNSGGPFPIPANIALPSFNGGSSSMPFLNSSFYSLPAFNISQNQHMLSLPHATKISDNKLPAPEKNGASVGDGSVQPNNNNNTQIFSFPVGNNNKHGDVSHQGSKNRAELVPQPFPLSFSSNASSPINLSSMAQNSAIFQMLPEMPWNGNKNLPTSEGGCHTRGSQSLNLSKSDSTMAPSKFGSLSQSINFLPSPLNSVAIPNFYHHQHQMQQLKASTIQTEYSSFLPKWDNFPRTTAPEGSSQCPVNISQLNNSQSQNHINFVNNPGSIQGHHHAVINSRPVVSSLVGGSSSNSSVSKNTSSSRRSASVVVGKGTSTVSILASQETEGSQKSSPACRRNMSSILSTRASQLSELKYS